MHISVLSTRASFFSSFLLLPPRPFAVYVWHFAWNGNARREREREKDGLVLRPGLGPLLDLLRYATDVAGRNACPDVGAPTTGDPRDCG